MSNTIVQCGCYFCITEDRDPFPELKAGCDDDAVQGRELSDDLSGIALGLFLDQGVDHINRIEEPQLHAVVDQGASQSDGTRYRGLESEGGIEVESEIQAHAQ